MKLYWSALALLALCLAPPLVADTPKDALPAGVKVPGKVYQVPYRLTDTNHLMVRVKINGKGPFSLIVDTGAPLLYLAEPAAKQAGLKVKKKGGGEVVKLDRFEIEGGVTVPDMKCVVETPFQLKGMNAFGMAGEELHGMIGYTVLSHFKMEIDLTRPKMTWTRLNYKPAQPVPLGLKDKDESQKNLENLGGFMQAMALMMGKKKQAPPLPRGFLGIELAEKDGAVTVRRVLKNTPAAAAGLRKGDRISEVQGKEVTTCADVLRLAATVTAGETVRLTVARGEDKKEISVTAGEGL